MLANITKSRAYQIICTSLFGLVLVALPFTSFPPLRQIAGSLVAPLSAIPLAGIMLVWLLPYLVRKGQLPSEILPLLYFVAVALAVSAGAFFLDGFYTRGKDFLDQSLRAFVTVGIGLSFYITLSAYMQDRSILRQGLRFIYIAAGLVILWSIFEIYLIQTYGSPRFYPAWVVNFRAALVYKVPGLIYSNRVTGFAYEPSWYVLFFDLTLFPIWLSSVFQRKSLFKTRLWVFQVEDLLLTVGAIVFTFSFPRIGLIALFAMIAYLALIGAQKLNKKITAWVISQKKLKLQDTFLFRALITLVLLIIFAGLIAGAIAGVVKIASQTDYRYQLFIDQVLKADISDLSLSEDEIIIMARRLAFYERTVFWFGGWNIFKDYPFGVGLGNAGFYFIERMNPLGYGSYEIRNLIFQADHLINTKALWLRLLSETGFIGFGVFITWVYVLWRSAGLIQKSQHTVMKIVGLAGKLYILAYIVEGFGVDSFAIPYHWIMASFITAGGLIARKEIEHNRTLVEKSTSPDPFAVSNQA